MFQKFINSITAPPQKNAPHAPETSILKLKTFFHLKMHLRVISFKIKNIYLRYGITRIAFFVININNEHSPMFNINISF